MQSPKRLCVESKNDCKPGILDLPVEVLAHVLITYRDASTPPGNGTDTLSVQWVMWALRLSRVCRRFCVAVYVATHTVLGQSPARLYASCLAAAPYPIGSNYYLAPVIVLMRRTFPIVKQSASIVIDDDLRSARGVFDFLFAEGDDRIPCRIEIRVGAGEMTAFRAAFL